MPTPSSTNVPEPHSFTSTCPDDQTPSSWHPPPPYRSEIDEEPSPGVLTGDDDMVSRSATVSPIPPSPIPSSSVDRHTRDSERTQPGQSVEDSHKQTDGDEEMSSSEHNTRQRGPPRDGVGVAGGRMFENILHNSTTLRRRRTGNSASDIVSPVSANVDSLDDRESVGVEWADDYGLEMGSQFSSLRVIPTSPSSFLRSGSMFKGTQQSERQVYEVQVEIKHVDLRESFLCGYLKIQGLTEDHPTLTTYFEGEIIGSRYGFMTKHESWGANDRIDLSHWAKFTAFRQFARQTKKGNMMIKDFAQKENIFMRWKEHFLVPDHRVRTINGASFEGFYYICFNQVEGRVSGIYFHSKSEKFQQLELKHVEDKGCFGAMEFR